MNNLILLLTPCGALRRCFCSPSPGHALVRGPPRFGRLAIMVRRGTLFGETVLIRSAHWLDRLLFLCHDWLWGEVLPLVGLR